MATPTDTRPRSRIAPCGRGAARLGAVPDRCRHHCTQRQIAGRIFHHHDDGDDDQQDGGRGIELVAVERGVERGADAAAADDSDHRRLAEVDVEAVEAKPDHARHHLRLDAVVDPLQPAGAIAAPPRPAPGPCPRCLRRGACRRSRWWRRRASRSPRTGRSRTA
jgi:hypothetical protein